MEEGPYKFVRVRRAAERPTPTAHADGPHRRPTPSPPACLRPSLNFCLFLPGWDRQGQSSHPDRNAQESGGLVFAALQSGPFWSGLDRLTWSLLLQLARIQTDSVAAKLQELYPDVRLEIGETFRLGFCQTTLSTCNKRYLSLFSY